MQHDVKALLCLNHNSQALLCFAALDNIETYLMSRPCMSIKEVQHIHNNCHRHTILKRRRSGEAGKNVTYRRKDFKQHRTSST